MQRFDREPSRAKNQRPLPWVGDPERWGGSDTASAEISAAGGGPIVGHDLLRAQTRDLVAVGWDLVVVWEVSGFNPVTDTIQILLDVTIGTGQASSRLLWDCGTLSPAGNVPNPQAVALGWLPANLNPTAGVAISGSPIIATALSARWGAAASSIGLAHSITISIQAHCAPRAWAP